MTNKEAIEILSNYVVNGTFYDENGYPMPAQIQAEAFDMAIEALQQEPKWIPVTWHEITEAERAENGYPKDWVVYMDCEMPSDEQEILVTTRFGTVEEDVCYEDGMFSLDSGYDWVDDVVAWMPLPPAYERSDTK